MRFAEKYVEQAVLLIQAYKGDIPLAAYLKQYFAQHKKHGSKDRKYISHLCYCYYRLGHAQKQLPVSDRLKLALFLCSDTLDGWAVLFDQLWQEQHSVQLDQRIGFVQSIYPGFTTKDIFPWLNACSEEIEKEAFAQSHLVQPDVFLRVRPGYENKVKEKLRAHDIAFEQTGGAGIALAPGSPVQEILVVNKEVVVQDYSSQQVGAFLDYARNALSSFDYAQEPTPPLRIWDCCAASGGKSILAWDLMQPVHLDVSDVRPSILHNLQQRFKEAGITNYHAFTADLARPLQHAAPPYDMVICDAPCSGSGTWSRTPEQLYFFDKQQLDKYTTLQQKIIRHTSTAVKPNGLFLYITCSVFKAENEQQVDYLCKQGFTLLKQGVIKGYSLRADSMFAALLKKA